MRRAFATCALGGASVGCYAPVPHWEEVAEDCPTEVHTLPVSDDTPFPYDEDCARRMAEHLGVEWADFPSARFPGDVWGSPIERVLWGVWLVASIDIGTVEDVLTDPVVPASFMKELTRLAAGLDIAPDEPAGRLLYEYVANAIVSVSPVPGWHTVSLTPWDDILFVPERSDATNPYVWAAVVLHESGHHSDRPHAACTDGELDWTDSADVSWDSVTGMQTWYLARVFEHSTDASAQGLQKEVLQDSVKWFCSSEDIPEEIPQWGL